MQSSVASSSVSESAFIGRLPHAAKAPQRRNLRLLALKILLFSAISLIGGELICRVFWVIDRHAPLLSRNSLWYAFYPQLRKSGVEDTVISNTDATCDVLILGGSTVSDDFGNIGELLGKELQIHFHRPVRVFNLAYAAHTSRDSMLKHRWLAKQHFDLVVVYDGINDTRMNNVPPDLFRDDYSHCMWYKHLRHLESHPVLSQSALPFTLLYTGDRLADKTGLERFLPRHDPRGEWLEYGKVVQTRRPYQQNLRTILDQAKTKSERVVLMTFAHYIPANYSLEAYKARQLDYPSSADTGSPVELYGKAEYITAALGQQNEAVCELAAEHPEAVFVDQARMMPPTGRIFYDCCHFTPTGCALFTQHIVAALGDREGS